MLNYFSDPFGRPEQLGEGYIIATYLVFGVDAQDVLDKCGRFAVGQTVGTWVQVPGVTKAMVDGYQARVVELCHLPGSELCFLRLAFPKINFCNSFTMLLTALVGNDVSTALRVKLVNLTLDDASLADFSGPRQSIAQLRQLTGVSDRPIVLNMIKPCLGFSPAEGARLFFEVAKGGVDLIKDDELLANPDYSPMVERVRAYNRAAAQAAEYSGKQTLYMVNITDSPRRMRDNAKAAIDAGAKACLVNFIFGGLDLLREITDEFGDQLFIMGHYAGFGVMSQPTSGISNQVMLGLLPRLAGAHAMMTMFPDRGDHDAMVDFYTTVQTQKLPLGGLKPIVTTVGGGVTPLNLGQLQEELGNDIILGVGGAIQGHPTSTTVGAETVMAAVNAAARGVPLEEAACSCAGLRTALEVWGKKKEEAR